MHGSVDESCLTGFTGFSGLDNVANVKVLPIANAQLETGNIPTMATLQPLRSLPLCQKQIRVHSVYSVVYIP